MTIQNTSSLFYGVTEEDSLPFFIWTEKHDSEEIL